MVACNRVLIRIFLEPFKYRKRSIKHEDTDGFEEKPIKHRLNGSYMAVSTPLSTKLRLKRRTSEELNGSAIMAKQLKLDLSPINE